MFYHLHAVCDRRFISAEPEGQNQPAHTLGCSFINRLPNDKILDWSEMETNCRRHFKVHLK